MHLIFLHRGIFLRRCVQQLTVFFKPGPVAGTVPAVFLGIPAQGAAQMGTSLDCRNREVCNGLRQIAEKLFAEYDVAVDDEMLTKAGHGDVCFLENMLPPEDTTDLIVFKWNRRYPGDMHFEPTKNGFTLISSEDFEGNSHEKITMETYKK